MELDGVSTVLSVGAREFLWMLTYRPIRRGSKQSGKGDGLPKDIPISKGSKTKSVCWLGSRSIKVWVGADSVL